MNAPGAPPASFPRRVLRTLKGLILWSHDRGTWQYDLMVALILVFVLLAPARWFHDKPVYNPSLLRNAVLIGREGKVAHYRVSAEQLAAYDADPRKAAEQVFALDLSHPFEIQRIEPIRAQNGAVVWYDVWVRELRD
jgi:hypothetical protein